MTAMFTSLPWATVARRFPQLLGGLVLCGLGVSGMVLAGLGLGPWDVLHQGVSFHTGWPIGTVSILFGFAMLIFWIPLRERVGLGTLCNIVLIGEVMNIVLAHVSPPTAMPVRIALMAAGPILFGIGGGLYIGAGLGPGPRDGVMTGLARRGLPVWLARGTIEVTAMGIGWLLGGDVGIGTIWFAVGIGPIVHLALHRFRLDAVEPVTVIGAE